MRLSNLCILVYICVISHKYRYLCYCDSGSSKGTGGTERDSTTGLVTGKSGSQPESGSNDPSGSSLTSSLPESDPDSTDANQPPSNELQPSTNSETYTKVELDLLVKSSTNHFYYTKNQQTGFEFYLCKQGFVFNSVKESVGSKCLDYLQSITGSSGTTLSIENGNSTSLAALEAPKSADPNTLGASPATNLQGSSSDDSEPCVSKAIWAANGGTDVFAYYVVVGSTINVRKTITLYLTDGTIKRFHKARHYAQWVERPLSVDQPVKAVDLNNVYENVGKFLYMKEDLRAIKSTGEPAKKSGQQAKPVKQSKTDPNQSAKDSTKVSGGSGSGSNDPDGTSAGGDGTSGGDQDSTTKTGTDSGQSPDGTSGDQDGSGSSDQDQYGSGTGTGESTDPNQASSAPLTGSSPESGGGTGNSGSKDGSSTTPDGSGGGSTGTGTGSSGGGTTPDPNGTSGTDGSGSGPTSGGGTGTAGGQGGGGIATNPPDNQGNQDQKQGEAKQELKPSEYPTDIKVFTGDTSDSNNLKELEPSQFKVSNDGDNVIYEFNDGVRCTKIQKDSKDVWVYDSTKNDGKHPKSIQVSKESAIIFYDDTIEVYTLSGEQWYFDATATNRLKSLYNSTQGGGGGGTTPDPNESSGGQGGGTTGTGGGGGGSPPSGGQGGGTGTGSDATSGGGGGTTGTGTQGGKATT